MKFKDVFTCILAQCQYLIPQHTISRLTGYLANCESPWVKTTFIKTFIRIYPVNLAEAESNNINFYKSFNQFFTRHLKSGTRRFDLNINMVLSPVDGIIEQYGSHHPAAKIKAKKSHFDLSQLLANNKMLTDYFDQGQFVTLYLAPQHYHRVHMPLKGKLLEMIYVPGKLFSVNHHSSRYIANLFSRNERVICLFETAKGRMALILVGALNVGSIHTKWHGPVKPEGKKAITTWNYSGKDISLEQGEELGYFQMGSTVILLFPKQSIVWSSAHLDKKNIQLGELLGTIDELC